MRTLLVSSLWVVLAMSFGCGSSTPPPDTPVERPEAEPAKPPAKPPEVAPDADDRAQTPEDEPVEDPTEPEAEEESEPSTPEVARAESPASGMRPSQPPSEILTAPKVAFMINYPASQPKRSAEEKCTEEFGEDFEARAKCMAEARKEFLADVMLFKKEANGSVWWIIYRRDRGTLFEVSKSLVELTNETENSVTLKSRGRGTGARPLFIGAQQMVVQVPSDSSIELNDPKLGTLVYEAKIGLVGN